MVQFVNLMGINFEVHACIQCGIPYTVPSTVIEAQRQTGGFHYCSNGHGQGWDKDGATEFTRIRRERDRLLQDKARIEGERNEAELKAQKAEYKVERLKRRSAAGLCPCCNRHFAKLGMHMKTKHPNVLPMKKVPAA